MNTDSREMIGLIRLRGETPVLVAADDDCQLWRFADGTEVLLTSAGVVTEDDEGFAETRADVARARVATLRNEAVEAGDDAMVKICAAALVGDRAAMAEVIRCLREALAQREE